MATTSGNHLLEIIPNRINVQEEARLYDELCEVRPTWVESGYDIYSRTSGRRFRRRYAHRFQTE